MDSSKKQYKYFVGTKEQFLKLIELNKIQDNYIIFISDTHELYKGTTCYTSSNFIIDTKTPSNPIDGCLYCINGELQIYNNNQWELLSKPFSLSIDNQSTNDTIPTSKAVIDAISSAIKNNGQDYVSSVSYTDVGTITVYTKTSDKEIVLNGMVTKPSYDDESRTLTFPIIGDKEYTVSFGKDVAVERGIYNPLNNSIQLTRTDGEVISIDCSSMNNIVATINSSTVGLEYDSDGKLIANVYISNESNNCLTVKDDGLYVKTFDETALKNIVGDIPEGSTLKDYVDSKVSETDSSIITF